MILTRRARRAVPGRVRKCVGLAGDAISIWTCFLVIVAFVPSVTLTVHMRNDIGSRVVGAGQARGHSILIRIRSSRTVLTSPTYCKFTRKAARADRLELTANPRVTRITHTGIHVVALGGRGRIGHAVKAYGRGCSVRKRVLGTGLTSGIARHVLELAELTRSTVRAIWPCESNVTRAICDVVTGRG